MSNRVLILALYRLQLFKCVRLGYKLGSKPVKLKKKPNGIYNVKVILGKYIFDRVKQEYKKNKNITDNDKIDQCIDDAFDLIRQPDGKIAAQNNGMITKNKK
mgnify:CR=1 FL=1